MCVDVQVSGPIWLWFDRRCTFGVPVTNRHLSACHVFRATHLSLRQPVHKKTQTVWSLFNARMATAFRTILVTFTLTIHTARHMRLYALEWMYAQVFISVPSSNLAFIKLIIIYLISSQQVDARHDHQVLFCRFACQPKNKTLSISVNKRFLSSYQSKKLACLTWENHAQ